MCDHKVIRVYSRLACAATLYEPAEYFEWAECMECGEEGEPTDFPGAEVIDGGERPKEALTDTLEEF